MTGKEKNGWEQIVLASQQEDGLHFSVYGVKKWRKPSRQCYRAHFLGHHHAEYCKTPTSRRPKTSIPHIPKGQTAPEATRNSSYTTFPRTTLSILHLLHSFEIVKCQNSNSYPCKAVSGSVFLGTVGVCCYRFWQKGHRRGRRANVIRSRSHTLPESEIYFV